MLVRNLQFALGKKHAVRFDAADHALLELEAGARNESAGGGEDALHAAPGIGRATYHLDHAVLRLDIANAEAIGAGMFARIAHMSDGELTKRFRPVAHLLDFESDADQTIDDLIERSGGVEVLLEPGEGEFHDRPPASVGTCKARKP